MCWAVWSMGTGPAAPSRHIRSDCSFLPACCPHLSRDARPQAAAPGIYKALAARQAELGLQLGDVRSCVSVAPLSHWELSAALRLAVVKSLTGSSCGAGLAAQRGAGGAGASIPFPAQGGGDGEAAGAAWTLLEPGMFVGADPLVARPGDVAVVPYVRAEVYAEPPERVLLVVRESGVAPAPAPAYAVRSPHNIARQHRSPT